MNQKQWKIESRKVSKENKKEFFYFRNLAVKELGACKGYVIHHLRDTEEQRTFNDTYYERWGFDFDCVCKYCVLMKVEDHRLYHTLSEETRKKIGDSNRATKSTKEYKDKVSGKNSSHYGKHFHLPNETKAKISLKRTEYLKDENNRKAISIAMKEYYKNNPRTEDDNRKTSEATKKAMADPNIRKKISERHKGNTYRKGKRLSEESKKKISESNYARKAASLYREYKASGGLLNWNQWQKAGYPLNDNDTKGSV